MVSNINNLINLFFISFIINIFFLIYTIYNFFETKIFFQEQGSKLKIKKKLLEKRKGARKFK